MNCQGLLGCVCAGVGKVTCVIACSNIKCHLHIIVIWYVRYGGG